MSDGQSSEINQMLSGFYKTISHLKQSDFRKKIYQLNFLSEVWAFKKLFATFIHLTKLDQNEIIENLFCYVFNHLLILSLRKAGRSN
jgi:hypothetical protein